MANHIQNRGPARHAFTDLCLPMFARNEIRRREVTKACRCAMPQMGLPPSKVSTSDHACVMTHFLISAKSETLLSRPLSASMYTNFA